MSTQEKLHPIASRILFEDDEVRVWDQVIEEGETLGKHHHQLDYVLVNLTDGLSFDVARYDSEGKETRQNFHLPDASRGSSMLVKKGHIESARNIGPRYRAILVELKEPK